MTPVLRGFPQSNQATAVIIPWNMPRLFSCSALSTSPQITFTSFHTKLPFQSWNGSTMFFRNVRTHPKCYMAQHSRNPPSKIMALSLRSPHLRVQEMALLRYLSYPVPGGITGLLSPQGDINSGDWPSRLGIGRNASDLTLEKLTATKSQTRIDGVTCPRKPKSTKGCSANGRRRLWRFAHSAGYMWMSAQGQEIGHNFLKNSYLHSIHHHLPHLIRRRITYEGHVVVT
jgi:hypothetical protein